MFRVLTQDEVGFVSGGEDWSWVPKIIEDISVWIGQTIQNGGDGAETYANNYVRDVTNGNPNWIDASNGWLFDTNSGFYALDNDGDGYWNYAGEWNGNVFSMYDGLSWSQAVSNDDPVPLDDSNN